MPRLTVITDDNIRRIPFQPGRSLRQVLEESGIAIRSGCLGNGACGLCRVEIEAGQTNPPNQNETLLLASTPAAPHVRLACQVMPERDLTVRVPGEFSRAGWRDLPPDYLTCSPPAPSHRSGAPVTTKALGLAIDLGTTNICLSIRGLEMGERLAGRTGPNPQSRYGADVVTRLVAAAESKANAREIARLPLEAVREALLDIGPGDGLRPEDIVNVAVVGNTPMMVLLTETDPRPLLQPEYWTKEITCRPVDARAWANALGVSPKAIIAAVPPLAGFVGSDLLAGVLATGMMEHQGSLFIDFGTNSEIALWDGAVLWVTSAAGGPAFEGSGIRCGMPAEPGAIFQAEARPGRPDFEYRVIGGGRPAGFCGSGLVDLIAGLRRTGNLTPTGKLVNLPGGRDFVLAGAIASLRLTGGDVDLFQRAKAAIGAGVATLLSRAGMGLRGLQRVYVGGAFGRHLNIVNARSIGLLPDVPPERVELCGNTALAGCEQLLMVPGKNAELARLRKRAMIINMSRSEDFETLFLENLYLKPQRVGQP
jgi:uncharacterized 2Fe-2S/4Fe-4S cluster protein (DUF4445 family)